MNVQDLRQLELDELRIKVEALEEDLFKVKFQHATAQLSDTSELLRTRRTLARAKTILAERVRSAGDAAN
jgi:large subunit ribosomal protein L29